MKSTVGPSQRQEERPGPAAALDAASLLRQYRFVRGRTETLCEALACEDYVIQSMPDASPVKWHLAHTSWFFETFVLTPHLQDYRPFHPQYGVLFNSYYEAVGPRWPRAQRGLLSRPTVDEVRGYRHSIDEYLERLFQSADAEEFAGVAEVLRLGLHHEQQHQELILTDLQHAWSANPLHPVYGLAGRDNEAPPPPSAWIAFDGGVVPIGHDGDDFAFDNESPRHCVYLQGYRLANRLVTNQEFLDSAPKEATTGPTCGFRTAGPHARLRTGPRRSTGNGKTATWFTTTLGGFRPLDLRAPVCHVSYYEADAYARWAGARLPTEAEWESAAATQPVTGHFQEGDLFRPAVAPGAGRLRPPIHAIRGRVAVDGQSLRGIPRLPARRRSLGRVQRQVHVQPDGPARRFVRHASEPCPPNVPQFLLSGRPLAICRDSPGPGVVMTQTLAAPPVPFDCGLPTSTIRADVLRGLASAVKAIPSKYFYDEAGSKLFDKICDLEEYYPTRTELAIMERRAGEMTDLAGPGCLLVEYGSGSSIKSRLLLDRLEARPPTSRSIFRASTYMRRPRPWPAPTRAWKYCRSAPTSPCRSICLHPADGLAAAWFISLARRSAISRRGKRSTCCVGRPGLAAPAPA